MKAKTRTGIARPVKGTLSDWPTARGIAKDRNVANGRGHRALKAQTGGYSVIFRPAVAVNKQRRVRDLSVR